MDIDSLMEYLRVWIEGLNRGDVSAADVAFAPDCVVHFTGVAEPFRGIGPWKDFVTRFLNAFPDLHVIIEDQVVQRDRVAFRFRATGTHKGPLAAAPATGRRITIDGIVIDRVVRGKVQERWEQLDQSIMLQQLGLT